MEKTNYATKKAIRERAAKLYGSVEGAFKDKKDQTRKIEGYWDIYNCKLTQNQMYVGDSQVFVPVVHDGIEASVSRYVSMLMPTTGRCIEVISETGDIPSATIAILEHYIRAANLRTLLPGAFRRGAVEGQWSLMLDWVRSERKTRRKVTKPDPEREGETITDMEDVTIITEAPEITVLAAQDLAVIPSTAASIKDADMVIVALRLTESRMDEMVEDGTFIRAEFEKMRPGASELAWADKDRSAEAGVKVSGADKYYLVYQVWTKFKLEESREPCIIYFGGENTVLGIEKNPYWSGKVPILSQPVDLVPGSFWGKSRVSTVEQLQYQVNDAINMGMDSAKFSVLPIVMTDPVKNPNVGSMMLSMGAIWETNPNDTQFAQMPALWKDSFQMVSAIKAQIMESMGVNDAMMGRAPQGRKNAQAIAQQEAAAMASISDPVRRFEAGIMDELLEWFFELDQQFRDDDLFIRTEGDVGLKAQMQRVPPQAFEMRYFFKWNGLEQAMGAQRVQQMLGFMNVLRGLPPQQLNGKTLDITPVIDYANEVICGANIAPRLLVDMRSQTTVSPDIENEMMHNGLDAQVSPADNDAEHAENHIAFAERTGDLAGHIRKHLAMHAASMQAKAQAAMPPPPKGLQGIPGGGGSPGVAGTPRIGSMPAGPRGGMQNPPGSIHPDQMQDASVGSRG